jgi:hypothetical protein
VWGRGGPDLKGRGDGAGESANHGGVRAAANSECVRATANSECVRAAVNCECVRAAAVPNCRLTSAVIPIREFDVAVQPGLLRAAGLSRSGLGGSNATSIQ